MKTLYSIIIFSVIAVMLCFSVSSFYGYFYPMKYKNEILFYSSQYGVEPAIVASVANVESGFNERAKSEKGAIGIMQLIPSTAQWLAGKIKKNYNQELLFDGEYNIQLGSYYLSYLFGQFNDFKTAICAYNAGQGNVKKWLDDKELSKDGQILNKIPFQETKNYYNKVLKNYNYYRFKYKNASNN